MAISIGSNISAALAQRMLGRASAAQGTALERLASGMRINRASDDAAGLAISSTLSAHSRIYTQGLRNANDAISLLNIADGALGESTSILERLREITISASNGTYSTTQRRALDREALELQREYNRMAQTTSFNGLTLTDGKFGRMNIQAGIGTSETLSFDLGREFSRDIGTGNYQAAVNWDFVTSVTQPLITGDFNRDGKDDFFHGGQVCLSNGDGTFSLGQMLVNSDDAVTADFNRDGSLDIIAGGTIYLGNGDGTFNTGGAVTVSQGAKAYLVAADFNGDGMLDIVGSNGTTGYLQFGNGDGTFKTEASIGNVGTITRAGDINNDGKADLVTATPLNSITVKLSLGTGKFTDTAIAMGGFSNPAATFLDLNNDGNLDILTRATSGAIRYNRGRGDGTFDAYQTVIASGVIGSEVDAVDLNNDGYLDLLTTSGYTAINNGDGTMSTSGSQIGNNTINAADINGDGAIDIIDWDSSGSGKEIRFASTERSSQLERINLTTRVEALKSLAVIDRALSRAQLERGQIGSTLSRLDSATRTLGSVSDNYTAARSRIVDTDVAAESAQLTRSSILQQAAQSVLAQANLLPQMALTLLRG